MLKKILDSINFYFYKLENSIEELTAYSFYSDDYEDLISILRVFNKKFKKRYLKFNHEILLELKTKKKSIDVYKENFIKINRFFQYFRFINGIISFIKNSKDFYIPQGVFFLLKEFTKNISKNSRFIIYLEFELNYSYANLSKHLNDFASILKMKKIDDFLLFSIPYFNREDILSSTILGHEIGHFLENKCKLMKKISSKITKDNIFEKKKIQNLIEINLKLLQKQISNDQLIEQIFKTPLERFFFEVWTETTLKWIKEIISDKIGLRIFGLSYFFALLDLFLLKDPYKKYSESHPPPWFRLKTLINDIESGEYLKDIDLLVLDGENIGEKVKKLISFVKNNFSIVIKPEKDVIYNSVINIIDEELLKYIDYKLDESLKKYYYTFDVNEVIYLMNLLKEFVTPNEIIDVEQKSSKAAKIISILNAGWLFFLFEMDIHYKLFDLNEKDTEKKMKIRQKLNNLIIKAIELSKIHEELNKRLGE